MEYNDGNIRVRESVKEDAEFIAEHMRESDKEEIWASNHIMPIDAMLKGLDKSIYCRTIENGVPIAMFGICPPDVLGRRASIWMLATNDLDKMKIKFVRNCRSYIDAMLEYYQYLDNYVDVRNEKSIEWLKFLGASFEEPEPYGVEGKMFRYFYFLRTDK